MHDTSEDNCRIAGTYGKTVKLFVAEKLTKTAKRVIERLTKLPIYKQRAFHCLNLLFIPNRTKRKFFHH